MYYSSEVFLSLVLAEHYFLLSFEVQPIQCGLVGIHLPPSSIFPAQLHTLRMDLNGEPLERYLLSKLPIEVVEAVVDLIVVECHVVKLAFLLLGQEETGNTGTVVAVGADVKVQAIECVVVNRGPALRWLQVVARVVQQGVQVSLHSLAASEKVEPGLSLVIPVVRTHDAEHIDRSRLSPIVALKEGVLFLGVGFLP